MSQVLTVAARRVEERALNAWPALQQVLYDGWIICYAEGYTRRANSVVPFFDGGLDLQQKIDRCEAAYKAWGLPTVFKMPPWSREAGLDEVLDAQGYAGQSLTSVQVCPLEAAGADSAVDVRVTTEADDVWLAAYQRLTGTGNEAMANMRGILRRIFPETDYALRYEGTQAVACGRSVCEDGMVGLYGIATDPARRRQGYAAQLVDCLLARAARRGAGSAYLQVLADNAPAMKLYGKLGFGEAYRYWYRIKAA